MSTTTVKVLAVGSALGAISELFNKVRTINAKHGPFEVLLCTGDFFRPTDGNEEDLELELLLSGKIEIPITTYLMQGEHPLPSQVIEKTSETHGQLLPNLFLLGKSNLIVTSQGLRIGVFGGRYKAEHFNEKLLPSVDPLSLSYYTSATLDTFLSNPLLPQITKGAPSRSSINQYIDIAVTHEWPANITQHCTAPLPSPDASSWGVPPLEVIGRLRPRYYFASGAGHSSLFWERQPFMWDGNAGMTRFVSLGAFGGPEPEAGKKKERWFYAFSIAPQTEILPPQPRPANATPSPYSTKKKAPAAPKRELDMSSGENFFWGNDAKRQRRDGQPPSGYVCKICQSTEHFIKDCPERSELKGPPAGYVCKICEGSDHFLKDCPKRNDAEHTPPEGYTCKICNKPGHFVRHCPEKHATGDTGGKKPPPGYVCRACGSEQHFIKDCPSAASRSERGPRKEIGPDECWFCLSNPRVAKHLIVAIGSECYITAPKGQLPDSETPGGVPGGGHILIVPISHYPTLQSVPSDISIPVIAETEQYKSSLRSVYAKYAHVAVAFEVAKLSGKGGHAHVQVVPVPKAMADKVETAFRTEGAEAGVDWEEDPDQALEQATSKGDNYFKVDLPNGSKMVHIMKPSRMGKAFSLQFGRTVLANLLGLEDRIDWKACSSSEAEEKREVVAFQAAFGPFDIVAGGS